MTFHSKSQLTVGDVLWLSLLPGDKSTRHRGRRSYDDSDDEDLYDLDSSRDNISQAIRDEYASLGLDRDFCDHPCVVVDLLDGRDGDESKVSVCVMTSFAGNELIDHVKNASLRPNYLAIYPKSPTDDHPDVQLKLKNGQQMRKDGYVNRNAKAVPIKVLETRTNRPFPRYAVGYLRLDDESINILREESGYPSLVGTAAPISDFISEATASRPMSPVAVKEAVRVGDVTEPPSNNQSKQVDKDGPAVETPNTEEDQTTWVRQSFWPLRVLSDLAKFMYVDPLSDVDTSSFTANGSPWVAGFGQASSGPFNNLVEEGIPTAMEENATVAQVLRHLLFIPSFAVNKPECSLPLSFYKQLVHHASTSAVLPRRRRPVLVELNVYHTTVNLPHNLVPSGPGPELRRIPVTKARCILSVHLVSKRRFHDTNPQIEEQGEARTLAIRTLRRQRFLLCQSREGLHVEMSHVVLAEQAWKVLTQGWGPPDESWEGSLER